MIAYRIVAGDTLNYSTDAPTGDGVVYTASDGWTLKYRLIPRLSTSAVIDLTAAADGDNYTIAAIAADTASWTAGEYSAAAWVEKGAEKYTVEPAFSQVTILADPRTVAAGFDGRTQAQKALDDLNAALATYAGSNGHVREYEINGRRMVFKTQADITAQIAYWQAARAREIRADAIARGMADPRFAYVRYDGRGT